MDFIKTDRQIVDQEMYDHLLEKFGNKIVEKNFRTVESLIYKETNQHPFSKFK